MNRQDVQTTVGLLQTGQFREALELVETFLKAAPDDLVARLYRGMALRSLGRTDEAMVDFEDAERRALAQENFLLAANAAYQCGIQHSHRGDWEAAVAAFGQAADVAVPSADLCAGLCEALCHLDRLEEALSWGKRTIERRDREASCDPSEVIRAPRPLAFDPDTRGRNIVSYSLFGADRYYHECAVTLARTTPTIYPEFTARFYCDPDLPRPVLRALAAAEAQVMVQTRRDGTKLSPLAGIFWRFLAFDDPDVDIVLLRDVDSPVLPRERAAIDLWLAGDAPFYCLRDHPVHAELLLAGMWGGFTGLLPNMGALCSAYARSDHSKFSDQRFLRNVIWPRIRHATLAIDSCYAIGRSVDFPGGFPNRRRVHVGMSWTRKQILGTA